jgi:hypothetical protein
MVSLAQAKNDCPLMDLWLRSLVVEIAPSTIAGAITWTRLRLATSLPVEAHALLN